tara:strand:- start:143 stop:1222 length:1080 start_codon:yes stop_codon:yes gene_type:complete
MSDKKISQFTELTVPSGTQDFVPIVDATTSTTKKVALSNLPLSDLSKRQFIPDTTAIQAGLGQTRHLRFITSTGEGYRNNTNLTDIYIGSSVSGIGGSGFQNCTALTTFPILGSGIKSIGDAAFQGCLFQNIDIPNNVTSIGSGAFRDNGQITTVIIPQSATSTSIGNSAFRSCSNLETITLEAGLTGTSGVGPLAFSDCRSLSQINCHAPKSVFSSNSLSQSSSLTVDGFTDSNAFLNGLYQKEASNNNYTQVLPANGGHIEREDIAAGTEDDFSIVNYYWGIIDGNTTTSPTVSSNNPDRSDSNPAILQPYNLNWPSGLSVVGSNLVIHARADDSTWTAGTHQVFAGNDSVDVIKDL